MKQETIDKARKEIEEIEKEFNKEPKSLKQAAQEYEPPQTLNIAELDYISVNVEVEEETHTNKEGETFTILITKIDGKKYRVPSSVLDGIKNLLEKLPDMEYVQVLRSGSGMSTRYQVIPYNQPKR